MRSTSRGPSCPLCMIGFRYCSMASKTLAVQSGLGKKASNASQFALMMFSRSLRSV